MNKPQQALKFENGVFVAKNDIVRITLHSSAVGKLSDLFQSKRLPKYDVYTSDMNRIVGRVAEYEDSCLWLDISRDFEGRRIRILASDMETIDTIGPYSEKVLPTIYSTNRGEENG